MARSRPSLRTSSDPLEMAEREGFEPSGPETQDADGYDPDVVWETLPSSIASPNLGKLSPELAEFVSKWASLSNDGRDAILAILRARKGDGA